jgi:hypothetical protein
MRSTDANVFFNDSDFAAACVFGVSEFPGILDTADHLAFETAAATTHTLRYAIGPALAAGTLGTVAGVAFKVVGTPLQISATDMRSQLVKA